jgi:phosphatidate cytidylyltransferase
VLIRRLISSLVLVSLLLGLLGLDFYLGQPEILGRPGLVLSLLSLLLAPCAALELNSLWQSHSTGHTHSESSESGNRAKDCPTLPSLELLVWGTALMIVVGCLIPSLFVSVQQLSSQAQIFPSPLLFSFYGLLVAVMFTFAFEMRNFDSFSAQRGQVASRLSRAFFIFVYLILLFGMLIPHRWLAGDNALGLFTIVALLLTVKLADAMAFFVGRSFGSLKLAPHLSPKKTVEGAIGSLIGGYAGVAIAFLLVAPYIFNLQINKSAAWFLIYGLAIVASGIFGDLAESLLKRDADKKDSGGWLPGLGGLLDVLDSLVFAAPISYLLWNL